ncbi:hypothetical protein ACHQM5_020173 [Ranunculus cassubicifolius]
MSQTMATSTLTNPLKFLKPFALQEKGAGDIISFIIKGAFVIFGIVSVIFYFFSNFSSLACPVCKEVLSNLASAKHLEGDKTNISHILFGIGASVNSWKYRRHYSELWWEQNSTRGFVWLDENPNAWPETSPPYRVSEDTSKFTYTCSWGSRSAIRLSRIVLESFRLRSDNVRWFVLGDDDTVFFKENLVDVLSRYDHNQMYYIGGNSESVEQDVIHSYGLAYGGGGIALSFPLVEQLVKILDKCIERYPELYGSDERIRACVAEIGVPVTRETGFHQVDIRGDPYGLLAAHPVAPLVSLHHLDAVKPMFPTGNQIDSLRSLMTAYSLDPSRTLQQSFCYNKNNKWSVSVSWGYTVQIYPSILTAKELQTPLQTFMSWRTWQNDGPYTFNTRYMSPEACKQPVLFFLDRAVEVGPGETRTYYKRYLHEDGIVCGLPAYAPVLAVQNVVVSSSVMETNGLNMGRRRHCSEIVKNYGGVLHIKLRKCRNGETVSPP